MKKNILVLGSGGREYAFVWKFYQDKNVDKVFCAPGNAGTSEIATNISNYLAVSKEFITFCKKRI